MSSNLICRLLEIKGKGGIYDLDPISRDFPNSILNKLKKSVDPLVLVFLSLWVSDLRGISSSGSLRSIQKLLFFKFSNEERLILIQASCNVLQVEAAQ